MSSLRPAWESRTSNHEGVRQTLCAIVQSPNHGHQREPTWIAFTINCRQNDAILYPLPIQGNANSTTTAGGCSKQGPEHFRALWSSGVIVPHHDEHCLATDGRKPVELRSTGRQECPSPHGISLHRRYCAGLATTTTVVPAGISGRRNC